MMRKGYVLTMMFLMLSIVLSIYFSGLFDAATPRVQRANENTKKVEGVLNDIRDILNALLVLDIKDGNAFPSNKTLTLTEFKNWTNQKLGRVLWVPSVVENMEFEFSDVSDGIKILVTCELYEHVEIYPYKINIPGIVIKDDEIQMLVQYRKGGIM